MATVLDIITEVCLNVGYPVPTTIFSAEDMTYQQMGQCFNDAGRDLLIVHNWPRIVRTHTVSVVSDYSGQKEKGFALPSDFYCFQNDTFWNNDTQWPLRGPATPAQWRTLMVRNYISQFSLVWRNKENMFYIMSPPDAAQDISFEYQSNSWVTDSLGNPLTVAVSETDIPLLDPYVLKQFTRAKWLESKGFKSDAAYRDFYIAVRRSIGAEEGGTTLSLNRSRRQ